MSLKAVPSNVKPITGEYNLVVFQQRVEDVRVILGTYPTVYLVRVLSNQADEVVATYARGNRDYKALCLALEKVLEDMERVVATDPHEMKKAKLKATVGDKLTSTKDACVDACWDGGKRALTTTGKAVVGVAVAGTVGAIGWSIKSLFS